MQSSSASRAIQDRHLLAIFTETADEAARDDLAAQIQLALVESPGVRYAQRFRIASTKPLPGTRSQDFGEAVIAEVEGSPQAARDDIQGRMLDGRLPLSADTGARVTNFVYHPVSELFEAERFADVTDFTERHLMLIWSVRPSDPAEYDTWYDEVHIKDFLSAPGVTRAQRFLVSDVPTLEGSDSPDLGHLAFYEVDGPLDEVREEIKAQLIDGRMVLPQFIQPPFDAMFLSPVGAIKESAD